MKKSPPQKNIVIYQAKNGAIEFTSDIKAETMWASQLQIAELFGVDVRTVSEHIRNIYATEELSKKGTIRDFRRVQREGKREVEREVKHYNLDVVIAVGYRVNSKTATQFRQWATTTLREHITRGYTINRKQIQKNYHEFLKTVESLQDLLPEHGALDPKALLELIKEFSLTWMSLEAYDEERLKVTGKTKKSINLSGQKLTEAIQELKNELRAKGQATELFAQERVDGSVEGIVGNVMQSLGGTAVYKTAEEKSAHLLYFMVKNHPFVDGNKRSGAFAFIWFLRKFQIKGYRNINAGALTALTLLIAESRPDKKDHMTALVTQILK